MADQKDEKSPLILGDYTTDIFLYAEKWREESLYIREAPRGDYPFTLIQVPGGAGALDTYLRVFPRKEGLVDGPEEEGEEPLKSFYVLGKTEEQSGPVWRVDRSRGSLPWGDGAPGCGEPTRVDRRDLSDEESLIVMDFDGRWRERERIVDKLKNWEWLAAHVEDKPYLIRSHDPLKGAWPDFRKKATENGARPGIWVGVAEDLAEGALRRPGIWTDYRERIVEYLKTDSSLFSDETPQGWQHVVVIRIDYDGALVLAPGSSTEGELFVFPGDQPGSFLRKNRGHVVGGGIAFVASFVEAIKHKQYPRWDSDKKVIVVSPGWREVLRSCARQGLARSREVMKTGYLDPKDLPKPGFRGISILKKVDYADHSSVVECGPFTEDWDTACKIVMGTESEFRESTLLRIGDLPTVDPDFARGLLDLERRLKRHADTGKGVLSFAIFGEPGSGKSFVAKSLQKAIDPGDEKFKPMPHNLSQFGGKRERLVEAFKAVSQTSLQGKTPFVLWDEFDCARDQGKCGWLQDFLMPMEDAKFNEGKEVRQLGRCVFVFMGGIHEDAESFLQWMTEEATKDDAKLLKGPDFHSRLERTLQIPSVKVSHAEQMSIHQPDRAKLTRAILIRHTLADDQYKNIKEIEGEVLAYLLHVTLLHGVRSLKKIIEASALDKTTVFRSLHLPPTDVLKSHVAEAEVRVNVFLKGLGLGLGGASLLSHFQPELRWRRYEPKEEELQAHILGETESTLVECLAERTYEKFKKGDGDPSPAEYDKLPPLEKDRYEESARSAIRNKRGHRTDKALDD